MVVILERVSAIIDEFSWSTSTKVSLPEETGTFPVSNRNSIHKLNTLKHVLSSWPVHAGQMDHINLPT